MMESLSGLLAFVRTAETLSFVNAGQRLGLSPSAVGKSVARLEHSLGVRLLQRSTRRLSLTAEGVLFFERCRRILDDLDDAEAMLSDSQDAPRGKLRVSLPTIGYRFLVPHLPAFARHYPEVELDLVFDDRLVDVVGEGFDAVIRSGDLSDSRLMSRKLGSFRFVLVASPTYLAAWGTPVEAADLARHLALRFRIPASGRLQDWQNEPPGTLARQAAPIICNNMEAVLLACLAGLGIASMPDFLAADALTDGRLVSVLDTEFSDGGEFWILWPSSRQLSPKVRVFVDFCGRHLLKTKC